MDKYLTFDDVLLLPNYSEVTPSKVNTDTQLLAGIDLKVPLVSSPMDTVTEKKLAIALARVGGIGIIHRNLSITTQGKQVAAVKKEKLLVGASVGVGKDLEDRLKAVVKAGTNVILIDSAHGHTKHVIEATKLVKKKYPHLPVISGNVATGDGCEALIAAGANAIRVGMGPGSICTTRVMSGMGVPQLSAIIDCVKSGNRHNIPIIADGGIRASGDIVKALAAGAATVMLGSLFAGCDEAPGDIVVLNEKRYKYYRGMGSIAAMKKGAAERYGQTYEGKASRLVPEGVEGLVPYKGKIADLVHQLVGGIRSGMAYLGAKTLPELCKKAQFIQITSSALIESHPHSIKITSD